MAKEGRKEGVPMVSAIDYWEAEGMAKGRKEERENNIETVTGNIMKRNPGMSYEEAKENAKALFA